MRVSVLSSAVHGAQLALLNAPFAPGGWQSAMDAVAIATGSAAAQLIGIGGATQLSLNIIGGQIVGNRAHLDDPKMYGPCNWRINAVGAPMSIQHEGHYRAYAAGRDTADYDDAVADVDLPFGCQSLLIAEDRWAVGLSLLRRHRDGPCDADVLDDFAHLRRQTARAVMMQTALDNQAADIMLDDLHRIDAAVILLDRHGGLRAVSDRAELLFGGDGPLCRSQNSLWLRDPVCNRSFQAAIVRLLEGDWLNGPLLHRITIRARPFDRARWRLTLMRLPGPETGLGFNTHLAMTLSRFDSVAASLGEGASRG